MFFDKATLKEAIKMIKKIPMTKQIGDFLKFQVAEAKMKSYE